MQLKRVSLSFDKRLREVMADAEVLATTLDAIRRKLEPAIRAICGEASRITAHLSLGEGPTGNDAVILELAAYRAGERQAFVRSRRYGFELPRPQLRLAASY